jgi:GAF domain-containing protein
MTQVTPEGSRQDPLAAFWDVHFNDPAVGAFLSDVVSELIDEIGGSGRGIDWGITLLRSGETITLAAGSLASRAADEAQRVFDDGPARAAVRSGEFVLVGDTSLERRWPGYASAVAAEGARSILSVPLMPADVFRAAVNLYAAWPQVFTSADITAAVRLAHQVSRALLLVQEAALTYGAAADLSSVQLSRVLAGLALRTLVRDYGFSEGEALDYLRSAAAGPAREPAGGPQPVPYVPAVPAPHAGEPPVRRRRRKVESPA